MNPAMAEDEGQECKKHEAVECHAGHGEGRIIRLGINEGVVQESEGTAAFSKKR